MSKDGCRFFNLTPTFEDWLALKHREIDAARPDVSFINIVEIIVGGVMILAVDLTSASGFMRKKLLFNNSVVCCP